MYGSSILAHKTDVYFLQICEISKYLNKINSGKKSLPLVNSRDTIEINATKKIFIFLAKIKFFQISRVYFLSKELNMNGNPWILNHFIVKYDDIVKY